MTFDLHPLQVSNSYSTAQLQCDTGSKEAEVKIRKMLNKHMVGPQDSDSLLSSTPCDSDCEDSERGEVPQPLPLHAEVAAGILNFEVGRKKVRRLRFQAYLRRRPPWTPWSR